MLLWLFGELCANLGKGCVPGLQRWKLGWALKRGGGLLQLLVHPHDLTGERLTDDATLLQQQASTDQ